MANGNNTTNIWSITGGDITKTITVSILKLNDTHKRIIVGILIFCGVLGFMIGTDTTINSLFKEHSVNESHPVTNITVNGNGSSGTGNVENNVVYATDTSGTTVVQTVQDTSGTSSADTKTTTSYTGKTYTPDSSNG